MASTTLSFASEEALEVALTSGLVPREVQARAARVLRDAGGLHVSTDAPLGAAEKSLRAAGVGLSSRDDGQPIACWAEALRARPAGEPEAGGVVLFVAPAARRLVDLAAELLRLGCERQELRFLEDPRAGELALLRASDPPYYSLIRALDGEDGLRAFAPVRGREGLWIELGYRHPLAGELRPTEKTSLLVGGGERSWISLPDGPWLDLRQAIDLVVPATSELRPARLPERRTVPLRLSRAARGEPASLWVLRATPLAEIDRLLALLPEEITHRLSFAVGRVNEQEIVILRARAGRQGPPVLDLPGEAYAPLLGLNDLYAPADASVEPPLRRERLRELLASEEMLTWLAPRGGSAFTPERIAESAFAPLADWVDYLVQHDRVQLEPWLRGAIFEFAAFEAAGELVDSARPEPAKEEEKPEPKKKPPRAPLIASSGPTTAPAARAAAPTASGAAVAEREHSQLAEELTRLEREFLASEEPADSLERTQSWLAMAHCLAGLGRRREAGQAFARAVWELSGHDAIGPLLLWADPARVELAPLLAAREPTPEQVATVAAQAAAGTAAARTHAHAALRWLESHDAGLDVRSAWLARLGLARLAGGDRLALARARDRALVSLAHGLSLDRDVPAFLRFAGHAEAGASARLAAQLDALLTHFDATPRKRSPVEAPPVATRAYVLLTAAVAFARLGQGERARRLRDEGTGLVDQKDPVHAFLVAAYVARVTQALEGTPSAPLPAEVVAQLNGLEKFARYKVDRLRQASLVLEPQERLDPTLAFSRGQVDQRGEEFAALRGERDGEALIRQLERLTITALSSSIDERARLFDGVLDFLPQAGETRALAVLERITGALADQPPARRVLLLEEALAVAGHFARSDLAVALGDQLEVALTTLPDGDLAAAGRSLAATLRGLRRVGLGSRAASLLEALDSRTQSSLPARLPLAGGFASLGLYDRARPILAAASAELEQPIAMPQRLELVRALAAALGHMPQGEALPALAGLAAQLAQVTDSFNTNSHFCLSVVHFMESLLSGVASEELALGELGRRFLEEDELLVRRRIHRDLGEMG